MNIFSSFLTVKDGFSEYGSVNKKGKRAEYTDENTKVQAGRNRFLHLLVLFSVIGRRDREFTIVAGKNRNGNAMPVKVP